MCHALLQDPKFPALLLRIDHELAEQTRSEGCGCGGALHRADYPRKPRGCPREVRPDYSLRLSFCCAQCRKRSTSKSVRFLGRRVYLALAVVLVSHPASRADTSGGAAGHAAGRRAAHAAALARLVAAAVPIDAAVARSLCALHAAGSCTGSAGRTARTLRRPIARGRDATAGLAQPGDGWRHGSGGDRAARGSLSTRRRRP